MQHNWKPKRNNNCSDIATLPRLLLRADEAAECLAISPRTLWSLTQSNSISCVRIGKSVRYDLRDLTAWIDSNKDQTIQNQIFDNEVTSS